MLRASRKLPPRAREYAYVYSNKKGVPIFLCELSKHMPGVLLEFLNEVHTPRARSRDA